MEFSMKRATFRGCFTKHILSSRSLSPPCTAEHLESVILLHMGVQKKRMKP